MQSRRTNRWIFIPVVISFLLLAAHFSRGDQFLLMLASLAAPFLLLIRSTQVRTLIQILLLAGAFEWVWSTLDYMEVRKALGEDWQRLAIILFSVAGFTLGSGILLYWVKRKESGSADNL